jgi:transposase
MLDAHLILVLPGHTANHVSHHLLKALSLQLVDCVDVILVLEKPHSSQILPLTDSLGTRVKAEFKLNLDILDRFLGILEHGIVAPATTIGHLLRELFGPLV